MPIIESVDGKKKNIKCIGCSIQKGEIECYGGKVVETKNFEVSQDYEIPIPGFMIIGSKKHVRRITDFSEKDRKELIEFLYRVRRAMEKCLKIKTISIIQEEGTGDSHFHVWLFPRYRWMDKFGKGIGSAVPIIRHSKKYMKTDNNLKKIKDSVKKLRKYLS